MSDRHDETREQPKDVTINWSDRFGGQIYDTEMEDEEEIPPRQRSRKKRVISAEKTKSQNVSPPQIRATKPPPDPQPVPKPRMRLEAGSD